VAAGGMGTDMDTMDKRAMSRARREDIGQREGREEIGGASYWGGEEEGSEDNMERSRV
jgi:hypothetical protein